MYIEWKCKYYYNGHFVVFQQEWCCKKFGFVEFSRIRPNCSWFRSMEENIFKKWNFNQWIRTYDVGETYILKSVFESPFLLVNINWTVQF